jgi:hypothetical protein
MDEVLGTAANFPEAFVGLSPNSCEIIHNDRP